MSRFVLSLLATLALSIGLCKTSHAEFSSLEERMTGNEWQDAGLDKLSAEELETLNNWLRQFINAEIRAAGGSDPNAWVGFKGPRTDPEVIESRLVGSFSGWTGGTVFELENGQVWRQVRGGSFRHRTLVNPAIQITPEAVGTFALRVEGLNRSVRVERIK